MIEEYLLRVPEILSKPAYLLVFFASLILIFLSLSGTRRDDSQNTDI